MEEWWSVMMELSTTPENVDSATTEFVRENEKKLRKDISYLAKGMVCVTFYFVLFVCFIFNVFLTTLWVCYAANE